MKAAALASGSSGNCFYIENNNRAILIDAGISSRQICERLTQIQRTPENIKAIFITHEHSDHKKGADVFARQFQVPIFATQKTIHNTFLCQDKNLIKKFEDTEIAGMKIKAFSKSHKAIDPVSYTIKNGKKISVITDLGFPCENTITEIKDSDFLFLESNHDLEMLQNGSYPYFLKKWISSDTGHLSNMQSALAILENAKPRLKNLVLSHLSEKNNTPEIALETFKILKERRDLFTNISYSTRQPTELFEI